MRVRASLTPVGSRKLPYYMQYRTLDIGTGMCKVPFPPYPWGRGGGEFIKSIGEEYQVVKKERNGIITGKKEKEESNIFFHMILRQLERISSGEEGKGD